MRTTVRSAPLAFVLTLATATVSVAMGNKPAAVPVRPAEPPAQAPAAPATANAVPAAQAPVTTADVTAVATPGTPAPSGPPPKIVFPEMKYDFGELVGAEKVEHVYQFRNEGKGELRVDKVSTTCGCTAALLSAKVIPPGGTGEIKTTFTVGGRQGKQTKHIYVYSNDPAEPKACLLLEGTIIPPLGVEPATVLLQDRPAESVRTVRISQTLPQELELKEPATRLNMVTAAVRPEPPENGKKRYIVEIALKPDLERGRYAENVTIETNCAAKPKIDIPVRITVNGDIVASPSRISLGQLSPGQEITRSVTLSSTRDKAFTVLKAAVDNPAFSVSPSAPLPPGKAFTFTVTGKPSAAAVGVKATITFTLDDPKLKTIEVPVYGWMHVERTPFPTAPRMPQPAGTPPPGGNARP